MNAKKNLTRLNVLLPEAEYRYLYALLCEHEPYSKTGKDMLTRLLGPMGDKIDAMNDRWMEHYTTGATVSK